MNYMEIRPFDTANGEGVRVSLFVAGCKHHCEGCFNRESWKFNAGKCLLMQTSTESSS